MAKRPNVIPPRSSAANRDPAATARPGFRRNPRHSTRTNPQAEHKAHDEPDYGECTRSVEDRHRFEHVAIVAAAALPEPVMHFATGLPILHPHEKLRSLSTDENDCPLGDRLLNRLENLADVVLRLSWPQKKMSVLRHDHVGPDVESQFDAGSVDRFHQPATAAIFAEKWLAAKARKGQGMSIAGSVVPFASLAVRPGSSLAGIVRPASVPNRESRRKTKSRAVPMPTQSGGHGTRLHPSPMKAASAGGAACQAAKTIPSPAARRR